jgi:ABC-2 type transport system permease protein
MWREAVRPPRGLYRIGVIARQQVILLHRAPGPLLAYTVMPILLTAFLEPLHARLAPAGTPGINAAAPGMLVMFSLFMTGVIGDSLLAEREWNTWDRLHTTPIRAVEILVGKVVPLLAALLIQQAVVLGFAALAYHLDLAAAGWRLAVIATAWAVCVIGCGVALATFVGNHGQLSMIKDIGTLAVAGLGGALIPVALLPSWAERISPLSPGYWAMRGYATALSPHGGTPATAVAILVMTGAIGLTVAAVGTDMVRRRQR